MPSYKQHDTEAMVFREYARPLCGSGFNPIYGEPELLYSMMMGLALRANLDTIETVDASEKKHKVNCNAERYSAICKNVALDLSGKSRTGNALSALNSHITDTFPYLISFLPRSVRASIGVEPADSCSHKVLIDRIMDRDPHLFRMMPGDLAHTDVSPDGMGICDYVRSPMFRRLRENSVLSIAFDRRLVQIPDMPADHGKFTLRSDLEDAIAMGAIVSGCMDVGDSTSDKIRGRSMSIITDSGRLASMMIPDGFAAGVRHDIAVVGRMDTVPGGVIGRGRRISRFCTEYSIEGGAVLREFNVSPENATIVRRAMGDGAVIVTAREMSGLDADIVSVLGTSYRQALTTMEAVDIHLMRGDRSDADRVLVPRSSEAFGIRAKEAEGWSL